MRRRPWTPHATGLLPIALKREIMIYFWLTFPLWAGPSPSSAAKSAIGHSIHNGTVHEHPIQNGTVYEGLSRPEGLDAELTLILFLLFSALCITPRLLVGSSAGSSRGGASTNVKTDWRSGLSWAVTYHIAQVLFPRWLNWAFHFVVLSTFQAPPLRSLAFLEWLTLSITTCSLTLPPALGFAAYFVAELYIHPFRQQRVNASMESDIPESQRQRLKWFGRFFVVLLIPERYFPVESFRFALWAPAIFCGVIIMYQFVCIHAWSGQFPPESDAADFPAGTPFEYTPLRDKSSMRILRIYPSLREDDMVRCNLLQVPLDGSVPYYESISYRWEGEVKSETIMVNGFIYSIYPNVVGILKDLRSPFTSQYFWIDSICINQEDVREKEAQVGAMRKIYEGGFKVTICLSGAEPRFGILKQFSSFKNFLSGEEQEILVVQKMIGRLRASRVLQDFSPRDSPGALLSLGTEREWQALERLVSNPWFERTWIIQEVTVAPFVRLRYGGRDIYWNDLIQAMAALARSGVRSFLHDQVLLPGIDNARILQDLRRWHLDGQPLSLLDTMILCLKFKSTLEGLEPDYTADKAEIFTLLAWRLIDTGSLEDQFRLLRFAGIGQHRNIVAPSWVPDWTAGFPAPALEHRYPNHDYHASDLPLSKMEFSSPSSVTRSSGRHLPALLKIKGRIIDTIADLENISAILPPDDSINFPIRVALTKARNRWPSSYPYTGQPVEDAFWRVFIADTCPQTRPAPAELVTVCRDSVNSYDSARELERDPGTRSAAMRNQYRGLSSLDTEDRRVTHLLYTDLSKRRPEDEGGACSVLGRRFDTTHLVDPRMSAGRQFCISDEGYFGLVPLLSRPEDILVLFDGAKTPHVVRLCPGESTDEENASCQLLGESYIHGIMDGQLRHKSSKKCTFILA